MLQPGDRASIGITRAGRFCQAATLICCAVLLTGCAAPVSLTTPSPASQSTSTSTPLSSGECMLDPVIAPTLPAVIPEYTGLDETTGLHITGTYRETIDLNTYRLSVTGLVDRPLSLGYDELRCMPRITEEPVLECPGNFLDVAEWSGVPLQYVLDLAGVQPGAQNILLIGADGYQAFLPLEDALREGNFLAYTWEGQPLPILHGFPLRAVMPGMEGNKWTKWLVEIRVR